METAAASERKPARAPIASRKRTYALASWTVQKTGKGWFVRKTDSTGDRRGPYSTKTSACLTIARQLRKELTRRDGSAVHL